MEVSEHCISIVSGLESVRRVCLVFILSSEQGKQGSGALWDLHFYGHPLISSRTKCRKYQQFSRRQLAIMGYCYQISFRLIFC